MKRSELVKLLELVQPALSDTDLVPVFTHFMFCDGAVSASNDGLSIVARSKIVETDGTVFAVKGGTLLGLLKNSAGEDVVFAEGKEQDCVIKTGRSVFKLPYLTEDEFLFEEPLKDVWTSRVIVDESLLKGIEICLTTASTDQAAPAIMGVCFNITTDLTLYSCDGDAITQYNAVSPSKGEGVYMLPTGFCKALLKICRETQLATGTIEINDAWARAVVGGFSIYGRLSENNAPLDHAKEIEQTLTGKTKFAPLPDGFNEALGRARVVADPESKPTTLAIQGKKLLIETDTSVGIVRDELPVKGLDDVVALVHASLVQRSVVVCNQIAIRENCTAYKLDDAVLQVVSNIGE